MKYLFFLPGLITEKLPNIPSLTELPNARQGGEEGRSVFLAPRFTPSSPSRVKQNNLVRALSLSPPSPPGLLPLSLSLLSARQFLQHLPPPPRPPEPAASDGETAAPAPRIRAARAQIHPPAAPPDVMSRPHLPQNNAFPRANGFFDGGSRRLCEIEEADAAATVAAEQSWSGSPSQSTSPSSASSLPMSSCGQYMLHRVGKFDTLAGVAIKYGVEVMRRECCSLQVHWFLYNIGIPERI